MTQQFKTKLLHQIINRNQNSGFTLIELLVVVIILGVLAAVAMPNLIRQVGKAREVEIYNAIGSINRAQQAYHWERQTFAQGANDTVTINNLLGLNFDNNYIDAYNIVVNTNSATVAPTNNQSSDDGTRAYSGGMFVSVGNYTAIVCRSSDIANDLLPPSNGNTCAAGEIFK